MVNNCCKAQQLLERSEELLQEIQIMAVDEKPPRSSTNSGRTKHLKRIGRADLLIACIALACRAILVTRNLKHFQQVSGLQVENWMN